MLRLPAQTTQLFNAGNAVAIVAAAVFAGNIESGGVWNPLEHATRILQNRGRTPAADVEGLAIRLVFFEHQHVGLDQIVDVHKVAGLVAIFINNQWQTLQSARTKNAADPGEVVIK